MNALTDLRARQAQSLVLKLDGYEGPLDLLLDLARTGKIDLSAISILALVEQYLAVIETAGNLRLELAADWLVMAAWLAWLKSRLLLPDDEQAQGEAEEATQDLAARLADIAKIRAMAAWLDARPQLGRDVHPRGAPEDFLRIDRSGLSLDLRGLVTGYLSAGRRRNATRTYAPKRHDFWSVQSAIARLRGLIGNGTGWTQLDLFLPPPPAPGSAAPPLAGPATLASTLLASLELARTGICELRQDVPFGPLLLRAIRP